MSNPSNYKPIVLENVWIPMSDHASLAARIWLPANAEKEPVPAILEYIPYRKRDIKSVRDSEIYGYFAEHGYAGVRVDIRGSGDSDGILRDEYLQQELDDGLEILKWIAAQSWCSGKVGIFGLSWGGFNGLQLAALQPPELGAVVSVCSSDDRYTDDVHYMGGSLLTDNLSWASIMFAYNSTPPDPEIVGERWRKMWLERLEGSGLWIKNWLEHQHKDNFWKHASVCENYSAIQVPVMAVSGWADGYTNTVFKLMENLTVPRKGLVGPWGHKYPHMGAPAPTIDFLGECLRWWDRWLKDLDTGVDRDPMLTAWIQDSSNPIHPHNPGKWIVEPVWPADSIKETSFSINAGMLVTETEKIKEISKNLTIQSPLSVGLFAGKWCSYAESTDLPWDQREDDGGSLVFDSSPLKHDIEILGQAEAELKISSNKPVAMIAVRLSDVAPNDRASRVTFGILNLTHRESHENPSELEPGKRYSIRIKFNYVAQHFPAGNRIRLAISSSYWPLVWPSPEPTRLTIYPESFRLILPERLKHKDKDLTRSLGSSKSAAPPATTLLAPAKREWIVNHNLATNAVTLNVVNNNPRIRYEEIDLTLDHNSSERYSYYNDNYDTVRGEVVHERHFERGDWKVMTVTRTVLTSTPTHFLIRATLDAYEGDKRVFSKSWDESIKRDLV